MKTSRTPVVVGLVAGLVAALAGLAACSKKDAGPTPEEIAAQKKAETERRAALFGDKFGGGAKAPAPAAAAAGGSPGAPGAPTEVRPAPSYADLEEGTLPAAIEGDQVGSEKVAFGEVPEDEAPKEEIDKSGLFKERVLVPYHEADVGLMDEGKFGDRSAMEQKKKQLAPRVLELRLAALGKRVKQMHEAWMAQRGALSARSLEQEGLKLAKKLDPLMKEIEAKGAISLHVRDLQTQATLYDHRGEELRNPASNQKMLTTSAALDLLGPELTLKTEASRRGDSLYIVGGGDPTLTGNRVIVMAKELAEATNMADVKELIIDEGNFAPNRFIPGIALDDIGLSYMAPTGPLSMESNVIKITVKAAPAVDQPCLITVEPTNGHIIIDGQTATLASVDQPTMGIRTAQDNDKTVVVVRGKMKLGDPPIVQKRRIYDPGRFTGEAFAQALADAAGTMRLPVKLGEKPPNALLLKTWESKPLFEIVKHAMAWSDNYATEMVLRTLAWKMTGEPGDYDLGTTVLEGYWTTIGVNPEALVAENGSGLSRAGRFTCGGLVDLLSAAYMTQFPNSGLLAVLPVAGQPGTLQNRHKEARGRLKAKTGTLDGVSALSGILTDLSGDPVLALSIMLNPSDEGSMTVGARHAAEEKIVHALLEYIKTRKKGRTGRRR